MKKTLPFWLVVLSGIGEAILLTVLFTSHIDEKGLIASSRISALIWTIAAVITVGTVFVSRRTQDTFPRTSSGITTAGSLLFALGLVISGMTAPRNGLDFLRPFLLPLALIAGLAMVYSGICLMRKNPPPIWCYAPATVYLVAFMVYRYRSWSARPQLMENAFDVLACAALALGCYWHCAESCGLGNIKKLERYSALGIFFAMAALGHGEMPWLYACGAFWLAVSAATGKGIPHEAP